MISIAELDAPDLGVRFSGVAGSVPDALAEAEAEAAAAHADSGAGHTRRRRVVVV